MTTRRQHPLVPRTPLEWALDAVVIGALLALAFAAYAIWGDPA